MLHIETHGHRQTSHRTLSAAIRAAYRASRDGTPTAIVADPATLARLIASGAAYRTAQGEVIDTGRRWAITEV